MNNEQMKKLMKYTNYELYLNKRLEPTIEEKIKALEVSYNPDPIFTEFNLLILLQMIINRYVNMTSYIEAIFNSDIIMVANHLLVVLKQSHLLLYIDQRYIFNLL